MVTHCRLPRANVTATPGVKIPRFERREAAYLEPKSRRANRRCDARNLPTSAPFRVEQSVAEVAGKTEIGTTKTHAHRSVPLPTSLAEGHRNSISTNTSVRHPTRRCSPPAVIRFGTRTLYNRPWKPYAHGAGPAPRRSSTSTRHSAAPAMISAGANTKAVQTVLGHRSAAFTLTVYGHMYDADLGDFADRIDVADLQPSVSLLAARQSERRLIADHALPRSDKRTPVARLGSNQRPRDYESPALTTELRARAVIVSDPGSSSRDRRGRGHHAPVPGERGAERRDLGM